MALTVLGTRVERVSQTHEPSTRVHTTATMTPAFLGHGWTSPIVYTQTEPQPQWNTLGAGLGASAGPGTDDTIAWPLEDAHTRSGITPIGDYITYLGAPSRICAAISEPVRMFEDVEQVVARRVFVITNYRTPTESTELHFHWGNDTEIAVDGYEILALDNAASEAIACALIDPAAENAELVTFRQNSSGDVYCTPVLIPREPRNQMSHIHHPNEGGPYPDPVVAMHIGTPLLIASGGMAGTRDVWTTYSFEGGDVFFSSLQAVTLDTGRVLVLHLETSGTVTARIVTTGGAATTAVPVATGAVNLYQVVSARDGATDVSETTVVFTTRTATGGQVIVLDCSGTPTVTATATLDTDYSHAAWCSNRIAVLTRNGYNATAQHPLGFGDSPTVITLYDHALNLISVVDADAGLANPIQQTGTVHGFADGRLFMHCSSFNSTYSEIGHTYEYDGSGIRLWALENDTLTLQDQVNELDFQCSSTHAYRWGDLVFLCGPSGETYGTPPGDEQAYIVAHFVGGVLKEGNSDLQPHRLTDNWLIITEPEKNSIWFTSDLSTPFVRDISSMYVRAIHLDNAGVPDIIGEPIWLYPIWSWYSSIGRIDDTTFFHVGRGESVENALGLPEATPSEVHFHVLRLDTTTGNLSILHHEINSHPVAPSGLTVMWRLVQVGDRNRYMMLFSEDPDGSGVHPGSHSGGLSIASFDLHEDFSATILDVATIDDDPGGAGFTQRKPYELTSLSDSTYVATWVHTIGVNHWSSHRGIVLSPAGQITLGETLVGGDQYLGFQGVWMHRGCGLNGRYVYPCADEWPAIGRYPPRLQTESIIIPQRYPYAIVAMDIDPVTGDLTPTWYPCRVNIDTIDRDWYEANEFFAPEPQPTFPDGSTRLYQAHPDGGVYHFWELSQALPGRGSDEVWIFGGPFPVPWSLSADYSAHGISMWTLDHDAQVAWFEPGTWGQFGVPYSVAYMNGSVVMRDGLFALLSTTNVYSRAAPQGWNAGFGSNLLRVWAAGVPRGAAVATPRTVRVSTEERAT